MNKLLDKLFVDYRSIHGHFFGTSPVIVIESAIAHLPVKFISCHVSFDKIIGCPLDRILSFCQLAYIRLERKFRINFTFYFNGESNQRKNSQVDNR